MRLKHFLILQFLVCIISPFVEVQRQPDGIFLKQSDYYAGVYWTDRYLVLGIYKEHNVPIALFQLRPQIWYLIP